MSNAGTGDVALIEALLEMMQANQVDYTNLFRSLGHFKSAPGEQNSAGCATSSSTAPAFDAWAEAYRARLQKEQGTDAERKERMDGVNPKYILRNYLAQVAIRKAEKERDFSEVDRLLKLLGRPFDEQPEMENYAAPPPDWAQHIEVSCSS